MDIAVFLLGGANGIAADSYESVRREYRQQNQAKLCVDFMRVLIFRRQINCQPLAARQQNLPLVAGKIAESNRRGVG
jgi:hypothetical protein